MKRQEGRGLTRASALVAMQAKNAVLYVKSLTPRLFNPLTPRFPPIEPDEFLPPALSLSISALTPGSPSAATSGTTMKVPVKIVLSPAFARSTISARRITSNLVGRRIELKCWPGRKRGRGDSRSRHTSCRDLVRVLLDSDFLPVRKLRLLNRELPCCLIRTGQIRAHRGLNRRECDMSSLRPRRIRDTEEKAGSVPRCT